MSRILLSAVCAFLLAACTIQPPHGPPPAQPAPPLPGPAVAAEAQSLRVALTAEVPRHTTCGPSPRSAWIGPTKAALRAANVTIDRPQLIVAVDRNPQHQRLCILLARTDAAWEVIGGDKVSTGQTGRRGYFITPTGVFVHSAAILDWRAEGTFNENHIRGLGVKGMRVWDLGWQQAEKGWTRDGGTGEIRMLMHATDPDVLEARLGHAASKGCVRVSAAMNRFLDRHGVLDAEYEAAAPGDERIRALLLPDRAPTRLAGRFLVVIDSRPAS